MHQHKITFPLKFTKTDQALVENGNAFWLGHLSDQTGSQQKCLEMSDIWLYLLHALHGQT